VIDFQASNLHVVGYSEPVDRWLSLEELEGHLHSLPELPNAIPYRTSYYTRGWGFCLTETQRRALAPGRYRAVIDSTLAPGRMDWGELVLPGRESGEVLLSTYICHPSMANNELSGPVVTTALAQMLKAMEGRRYTYRILFLPETIGAILYLSRNLETMKRLTVAGFVMTCMGDEGGYSFLESRLGGTLADRAALNVLSSHHPGFARHSYLDRGSDERQYCSPGVDMPVVSVMRSKYHVYPEYHTSLDDMSFISPAGLEGSFETMARILSVIEANRVYTATLPCEPQLGRRGLYPALGTPDTPKITATMRNLLAYADGSHDVLAIAERIGADVLECARIAETLAEAGVLARSG
ncbi:MAG: DUF4910 domain-containing protein, partial [Rhodospirillales bacterium]